MYRWLEELSEQLDLLYDIAWIICLIDVMFFYHSLIMKCKVWITQLVYSVVASFSLLKCEADERIEKNTQRSIQQIAY